MRVGHWRRAADLCAPPPFSPLTADPEDWDLESIPCILCGRPEPADDLLLCDLCNAGCHASCMGVPLASIGEWWLCASCWAVSSGGQHLQWRADAGPRQRPEAGRRAAQEQRAQQAAGGSPAERALAAVPAAAQQQQAQVRQDRAAAQPASLDSRTERLLSEALLRSGSRRAAVPVARWAPQHLAGAERRLDQWLAGRLAASSRATLAGQRRQFGQFRELAGLPTAPGPEQLARQVACWVMGRSENGYKLSTIELGVHAVLEDAGAHWSAARLRRAGGGACFVFEGTV